jgi:hypothetical protein
MAIYRRDQPEYNEAVANGVKAIKLTTGGTFAGGKTWDGRQLDAPAPTGGSATPRLDAGVATPRLDKNPARSTADAVANSNRNGAFGTGPQQLQARKDLFNQMAAAKPQDRAKFQGQAAALGVKRGGWDAAMGRLNMTEPAATPPIAAAAPPNAPPVKPAAQAKAPASRPATTGKINWDGTNPSAANWNKPASPIPPTRVSGSTAVPLAGGADSTIGRNPATSPTPAAPKSPQPAVTSQPPTGKPIANPAQASNSPAQPTAPPQASGANNRWMNQLPAVNAALQKTSQAIGSKANSLNRGAANLLVKSAKFAGIADAANVNANAAASGAAKTAGAAKQTLQTAAGSFGSKASSAFSKSAQFGKSSALLENAAGKVSKVAKVASLGKVGTAIGKAAVPLQVAQMSVEAGRLAMSPEHRAARVNELESAVNRSTKIGSSAAGAWEGVSNPIATTYATGAHIKKAWDSTGNAKASGEALKQAESRSTKRAQIKAQLGDRWKTMTPKERVAAYNA